MQFRKGIQIAALLAAVSQMGAAAPAPGHRLLVRNAQYAQYGYNTTSYEPPADAYPEGNGEEPDYDSTTPVYEPTTTVYPIYESTTDYPTSTGYTTIDGQPTTDYPTAYPTATDYPTDYPAVYPTAYPTAGPVDEDDCDEEDEDEDGYWHGRDATPRGHGYPSEEYDDEYAPHTTLQPTHRTKAHYRPNAHYRPKVGYYRTKAGWYRTKSGSYVYRPSTYRPKAGYYRHHKYPVDTKYHGKSYGHGHGGYSRAKYAPYWPNKSRGHGYRSKGYRHGRESDDEHTYEDPEWVSADEDYDEDYPTESEYPTATNYPTATDYPTATMYPTATATSDEDCDEEEESPVETTY